MNWYLLGLVGALMGLAIQRFILAVKIKDDAGRDHCEKVFAVLVVALCVLFSYPAKAQGGHERYHSYYQHWKQPGSGISCCNANEYIDTLSGRMHISGDCEPTHAEIRDGHWWARVPQYMIDTGVEPWVEIPDDKIIHERNPSTEEGHLCGTQYWQEGKRPTFRILCFVPPDTGG